MGSNQVNCRFYEIAAQLSLKKKKTWNCILINYKFQWLVMYDKRAVNFLLETTLIKFIYDNIKFWPIVNILDATLGDIFRLGKWTSPVYF